VWSDNVPAQRVASIYSRRRRATLRAGQESVGFDEAVSDLQGYEGELLKVGFIDDRPRGGFYFQLFLDSDLSRIFACLGVGPL
jgi:hypothetical protein